MRDPGVPLLREPGRRGRMFAQDYRVRDGGSVLLETIAPPKVVLHVRERTEGYFDEGECIVDPERLVRVALITRYEHQVPVQSPETCGLVS